MSDGKSAWYDDQEDHDNYCKRHELVVIGDLGGWHWHYLQQANREQLGHAWAEQQTRERLDRIKLTDEVRRLTYRSHDVETLMRVKAILEAKR